MLHVRWIVPIAILSIGGRLEAQQSPKAIAAQVPVAPTTTDGWMTVHGPVPRC